MTQQVLATWNRKKKRARKVITHFTDMELGVIQPRPRLTGRKMYIELVFFFFVSLGCTESKYVLHRYELKFNQSWQNVERLKTAFRINLSFPLRSLESNYVFHHYG